LKLRRGARADLSEIWAFTAKRWSAAQADHYLIGLDGMFSMLCANPEVALTYGKFTPPVRMFRYRSHLVIFTADDSSVEVIRVVHGRSNWLALLAD
jgi:toxin ParE1/3/4